MSQKDTIAIKVSKSAEKYIRQGHPWVFESSIIKQSKTGKTGDIVIIFDQSKNKFLALGLLDVESPIRVKVLHYGSPERLNEDFIHRRMGKARDKRDSLISEETTAYRLIYGENDGFPGLIIDIYNDVAVVKLYSGIWIGLLLNLCNYLERILKCSAAVLRLNRKLTQEENGLENGQLLFGELQSEEVVFLEHGLNFGANLVKGHKTGYFLDHRHNRLKVRSLSSQKKVLDVFAYAGGFTVNALFGGAKEVTSVDVSAQALQLASQNVQLNDLSNGHKTLVGDAFKILPELYQKKQKYGLVIVDPPSFAKSEKQINKALYNYRKLVRLSVPLVEQGGILLLASCSSRVKKEEFFELIFEELEKLKIKYKVIDTTEHDIDHPKGIAELDYLKSIYLKII